MRHLSVSYVRGLSDTDMLPQVEIVQRAQLADSLESLFVANGGNWELQKPKHVAQNRNIGFQLYSPFLVRFRKNP